MQFIIFSGYLLLFSWLVTRVPFFRKSGLPSMVLAGLFILKVLAGCLYGWIHTIPENYASTSDTWKFYYEGMKETNMLLNDPAKFFGELFRDPYNGGFDKVLSTRESYWNDLKDNIMLKMIGIFNLLTRNHYYSNVILINFISFFGPVAIYRCFQNRFSNSNRLLLITGAFLIPSVLFWTSGLHKEGMLLTAIGLVFFFMNRMITIKITAGRFIAVVSGLFLVFILRNNVIFALFPALLLWWLTEKFPERLRLLYISFSLAGTVIFFVSSYIHPSLNLPEYVRIRNEEFKALGGNTSVQTERLQASPAGFLQYLPSAVDLSVLRPHPGDGGVFYIPFTIEIILGFILFLTSVIFPFKQREGRTLLWAAVYFSILLLLLIGFTVNNIGAIIRYRSLVLPFLFLPLVIQTDFRRLRSILRRISHR